MLNRVHPSWCPACRAEPGIDCPDSGKTGRQQRRVEKGEARREIAGMGGELEEARDIRSLADGCREGGGGSRAESAEECVALSDEYQALTGLRLPMPE